MLPFNQPQPLKFNNMYFFILFSTCTLQWDESFIIGTSHLLMCRYNSYIVMQIIHLHTIFNRISLIRYCHFSRCRPGTFSHKFKPIKVEWWTMKLHPIFKVFMLRFLFYKRKLIALFKRWTSNASNFHSATKKKKLFRWWDSVCCQFTHGLPKLLHRKYF